MCLSAIYRIIMWVFKETKEIPHVPHSRMYQDTLVRALQGLVSADIWGTAHSTSLPTINPTLYRITTVPFKSKYITVLYSILVTFSCNFKKNNVSKNFFRPDDIYYKAWTLLFWSFLGAGCWIFRISTIMVRIQLRFCLLRW